MTVDELIAKLETLRHKTPDIGTMEVDVEYCEPDYSGPVQNVEIYNSGSRRHPNARVRITHTGG